MWWYFDVSSVIVFDLKTYLTLSMCSNLCNHTSSFWFDSYKLHPDCLVIYILGNIAMCVIGPILSVGKANI